MSLHQLSVSSKTVQPGVSADITISSLREEIRLEKQETTHSPTHLQRRQPRKRLRWSAGRLLSALFLGGQKIKKADPVRRVSTPRQEVQSLESLFVVPKPLPSPFKNCHITCCSTTGRNFSMSSPSERVRSAVCRISNNQKSKKCDTRPKGKRTKGPAANRRDVNIYKNKRGRILSSSGSNSNTRSTRSRRIEIGRSSRSTTSGTRTSHSKRCDTDEKDSVSDETVRVADISFSRSLTSAPGCVPQRGKKFPHVERLVVAPADGGVLRRGRHDVSLPFPQQPRATAGYAEVDHQRASSSDATPFLDCKHPTGAIVAIRQSSAITASDPLRAIPPGFVVSEEAHGSFCDITPPTTANISRPGTSLSTTQHRRVKLSSCPSDDNATSSSYVTNISIVASCLSSMPSSARLALSGQPPPYFVLNPHLFEDATVWTVPRLRRLCSSLQLATPARGRDDLIKLLKDFHRNELHVNKEAQEAVEGIVIKPYQMRSNFFLVPIAAIDIPPACVRVVTANDVTTVNSMKPILKQRAQEEPGPPAQGTRGAARMKLTNEQKASELTRAPHVASESGPGKIKRYTGATAPEQTQIRERKRPRISVDGEHNSTTTSPPKKRIEFSAFNNVQLIDARTVDATGTALPVLDISVASDYLIRVCAYAWNVRYTSALVTARTQKSISASALVVSHKSRKNNTSRKSEAHRTD